MQFIERMRKKPKQERAEKTVDAVLEAAAQVLQKEGEAGFTTNRVAERAGFGIGTLYQYFPNKESIIAALAERERAALERQVRAALARANPTSAEDLVRDLVRVLIRAFSGRRRLRRFVVLAAMRSGSISALMQAQQSIIQVLLDAAASRQAERSALGFPPLTPTMTFVLTRAVQGAVRAAVLEENDILETREFEDELVLLVMGYLKAERRPADAP